MNRRAGGLDVQWLGRRRYAEVWEMQKRLLEQRIAGEIGDTLLLVEHEPVYTWGKRTKPEHLGKGPEALRALGADTFEVERGGEVTYHGPGQLVGYSICNLANLKCGRDLHKYMRALEEVIIRVLATYGVEGFREEGLTGVWVGNRRGAVGSGQSAVGSRQSAGGSQQSAAGSGEPAVGSRQTAGGRTHSIADSRFPIPDPRPTIPDPYPAKIAALGVRVRKWCTMHGFALNVTDECLPWFEHVVACGIRGRKTTSLSALTATAIDSDDLRLRITQAFGQVLGRDH